MGGKSKSSSDTSTSIHQEDNRLAATDAAIIADDGSGIDARDMSRTTITLTEIDNDAVSDAFGFSGDALQRILGFAEEDGEGNRGLVTETLALASNALSGAGGIASDALGAARDANAAALDAQSQVGDLGSLKELLKTTTIIAGIAAAGFVLMRAK